MKNIVLIILTIILYGCGYTSIYKKENNKNFQINVIELQGDNNFNNLIKNELKLYSNLDSEKNYDVSIKSDFKKTIISKNSTGKATDYLLSVNTEILVNYEGNSKNFIFEENIKVKNNSNSFEQNNYENNIKKNFASSVREQLLIKIVEIDDN